MLRGLLLLSLLLVMTVARPARAVSAADEARANAESAEVQFGAGNLEQALIHYRLAYQAVPNPDYLFNMAQCEYQLGQLTEALAHYQEFLDVGNGAGRKTDAVEMARQRIKAIHLRKSVFSINSLPLGADVRLEGPETASGQAPNDFRVASGKYRVTVSKPSYVTETIEVEIGIAQSKSLLFQLDPIPGRLEIHTQPASATLYVRGNRARNPYVQDVEPGSYELYAEAIDHEPRRQLVNILAGQHLPVDLRLDYVQRSGRPELIGFWTAAGVIAGTTGMLARFEGVQSTASGALVAAGGLVGGIAGGLLATAYVPDYIPDNVAQFRIGAMGIGAVEGAMIATVAHGDYSLMAGWTGGVLGLGAGALAGVWLDGKAPNYGRVTLIESSAVIGALAGALSVTAFRPEDTKPDYRGRYEPIGILAGLNVGLGVGLALAYLPDQRNYWPSWRRVALVDLATAAGAFAGAVTATMGACFENQTRDCRFQSSKPTARYTLAGGALGLAAGWFLTRKMDRDASSEQRSFLPLPVPSAIAIQGRDGPTLVPGLATQGRF